MVVLIFYMFWSPRFLIPVIPIIIILAGFGLDKIDERYASKHIAAGLLIVCIISSIFIAAAILLADRDFFADIRRSAEYIKGHIMDQEILSDETIKTSFWSKTEIKEYGRDKLKPGQYIALHSYYTDLDKELEYLQGKFKFDLIYKHASRSNSPYYVLGMVPFGKEEALLFRPKGPEFESLILYLEKN